MLHPALSSLSISAPAPSGSLPSHLFSWHCPVCLKLAFSGRFTPRASVGGGPSVGRPTTSLPFACRVLSQCRVRLPFTLREFECPCPAAGAAQDGVRVGEPSLHRGVQLWGLSGKSTAVVQAGQGRAGQGGRTLSALQRPHTGLKPCAVPADTAVGSRSVSLSSGQPARGQKVLSHCLALLSQHLQTSPGSRLALNRFSPAWGGSREHSGSSQVPGPLAVG